MRASVQPTAIIVVTCFAINAYAGLALSKSCGDTTCGKYEYCNSDSMCDICVKICRADSNNYEQNNCERHCQDYIHDHITSYVNASAFARLNESVETLQVMVTISLMVSVFLLIAIALILLIAWYQYRQCVHSTTKESTSKSNELKEKIASVSVIGNSNGGTQMSENTRLSLNIAATMPQQLATSATTTTTTLSTRHPSEDNTLEYAYDNPALTPSPASHVRRTETTF